MNIKLNRILVFVMVCRKNSFKKAGEALMISTPAVSKHIKLLESELGINLIYRSTRKIRLTNEGKKFYEKCDRIFYDLESATIELQQNILQPKGILKVSAPGHYGTLFLNDIFTDFAKEYPDIQLIIDYSDSYVDLFESNYDCAIRISKIHDSNMIMKVLKKIDLKMYAHKSYKDEFGLPEKPEDLKNFSMIGYTNQMSTKELEITDPKGNRSTHQIRTGMMCNNVALMKNALKKGLGICIMPDIFAEKGDNLVEIFPKHQFDGERCLSIVYHEKNLMMNRIRTFIDYLVERI